LDHGLERIEGFSMLELGIGLGVCIIMAKIASEDNESAAIWFCLTFALCVATSVMPLPYLRYLIAGGASFGLLVTYKIVAKR